MKALVEVEDEVMNGKDEDEDEAESEREREWLCLKAGRAAGRLCRLVGDREAKGVCERVLEELKKLREAGSESGTDVESESEESEII